MTSRTCALGLLLTLSACGPGGGGETGGSGGSASSGGTGPTPTTGAGITTTDTGGTSTGSPGTGSTSGPGTSATSTSSSTGSSGEPLTGSSSGSSGAASSTGGGGESCVDVSGDYGPCEAIIGYGFDGTACRAFSGCDCAPHCDDFAPDPVGCALGCAAAGECNEAALHPAGINKDPVVQGSFCDELDACASDPEALTAIFGQVECEPGNQFCAQGPVCHLSWQGQLDAALWPKVCAASLLPGADLRCVVFGP